MKKATLVSNAALALFAASTLVYAVVDAAPRATLMTTHDYERAARQIEREAKDARLLCARVSGYEKNVCDTGNNAEARVRLAELEAQYLGTAEKKLEARMMRVESQFDVGLARCDAFTGAGRDRCLMIAVEARAAQLNRIA